MTQYCQAYVVLELWSLASLSPAHCMTCRPFSCSLHTLKSWGMIPAAVNTPFRCESRINLECEYVFCSRLALEKVIVLHFAASHMQTGASGDGIAQSGLDISLPPLPPSLTPNPVSAAPLSSTKRKASAAFPLACAPRIKRSCTENWDQKSRLEGDSPAAYVGFHGSTPATGGSSAAIGGSTKLSRNLGESALSSLVNAHTAGVRPRQSPHTSACRVVVCHVGPVQGKSGSRSHGTSLQAARATSPYDM